MSLPADGLVQVELGSNVFAAFTTVHGGVSQSPWGAFNLGLHTGEVRGRVLENRKLLERRIGSPVVFGTQVHGTNVGQAPSLESLQGAQNSDGPTRECGEVDAIVVSRSTTAAAVLVADCVPILITDPLAGVGAAVHAGRAGLVSGVLEAALQAMVRVGADLSRTRAAVGPAACGQCYEVPLSMQAEVVARIPQTHSRTRSGTPSLDLPAGVVSVLLDHGVNDVQRVQICTIEDSNYYSYRRAGGLSGRAGRFAAVLQMRQ